MSQRWSSARPGLGVKVPDGAGFASPPVPAADALQEVARREAGRRLTVRERLALAQPGWLEDLLWRAGDLREWARGVWDPGPILRADRATWAAAGSLGDLGELTAQWLTGQLASQPGYYGPVDVDEADAPGLTGALVALCRAGAVTTGSQAGLVEEPLVQCAWVDAFVPDGLLARLQAEAAGTGYEVIVHAPGSGWVPVTWEQGKAWTSTGWVEPSHWTWLYQGVGQGAVEELLAAHQIAIIDPEPGRNTLWAWLEGAAEVWQYRYHRYPLLCDWCGSEFADAPDDPGDLEDVQYCGRCGPDGAAVQVSVIDPVPGRYTLWASLRKIAGGAR